MIQFRDYPLDDIVLRYEDQWRFCEIRTMRATTHAHADVVESSISCVGVVAAGCVY